MTDLARRAGSNAPLGPTCRRDEVAGIPSLARFSAPGGATYFVVVDPAAGRRIRSDGTAGTVGMRRMSTVVLVAMFVVAAIIGWVVLADGPVVGRVIVGAVAGLVAGGLAAATVSSVLDHRATAAQTRTGVAQSWKVGPGDVRAWRLCVLAVRIAACAAWRDATIDAGRQVPALLWSAVGRSLTVEQQRRDAERALDHESLRDLAGESLARTALESASLDAVEQNLQRVLIAAWSVQERRSQVAPNSADDRRRHREERELRARLTATAIGDLHRESDEQVDRSSGLVAEVETVAALLEATDRLLRESGSAH